MKGAVQGLFKGVKWVFIDLDDTLWDFTENSNLTLRKLYNEYKILEELFPDYNEYDEMYHLKNSELWNLYHYGKVSQEYLKVERFRWLLSQKRADCDFTVLANEMNDWYLDRLAYCDRLVDGAEELLQRLSKRFLIGIISNGFNDVQYCKLRSANIERYIQRMIISDEIGVQKPDKRIFDYALQEVGASVDEVIMIGDNADADVKGAINAGWKAIFFNRRGIDSTDINCDMMVKSLSEITDMF